jgi:hypothetical protein
MGSLREFGSAAWLAVNFSRRLDYRANLKTVPSSFGDFPLMEGAQYQDMGDSWFMTDKL